RADHFALMERTLESVDDKYEIKQTADQIRRQLNPHPAGQREKNIPKLSDLRLFGMQHKYRETILMFPQHGQTCHAFCTFCFRWPQFTKLDDEKFATQHVNLLIDYIQQHPEITDILYTGGDPMVMKPSLLDKYFRPVLEANIPHLSTIRIGTKSLAYFPYKYTVGPDSERVISLLSDINESKLQVAFMAHFNHFQELQTETVQQAARNIRETGSIIRTQSPVLRHINDHADTWATMWKQQTNMGMVPYYFFVVRDTGAQHYFSVPLVRGWEIFRQAYQQVSGISRTVRGPSMSCTPGKIEILGVTEIYGEKVITLQFIQGRNPDWVRKPFFAKYDPQAIWIDDLVPAFSKFGNFFFEQNELEESLDVIYNRERLFSLMEEVGPSEDAISLDVL
ncbi:MAG: KamA family radical SAM protein, partial [Candidatus Heimdallarchaeota archaeon]